MEVHNLEDLVIIAKPVNDNLIPLNDGECELENTPRKTESDLSDDALLKNLLKEFQMETVFSYLKGSHVTFRSLRYINKEDLKEAIPPLGLRILFREKLFAWKKKEFGTDEDRFSVPSKVGDWLKNCIDTSTSSVKLGTTKKLLDKELVSLLNESLCGNDILEFYALHENLTNDKRDDLISIIVEQIVRNDVTLRAQDFSKLLIEICKVFPTEKEVKEYYYIPRKGKNKPHGKLFSKYQNKRSKKVKLATVSLNNNSIDKTSSHLEKKVEEIGATNQT